MTSETEDEFYQIYKFLCGEVNHIIHICRQAQDDDFAADVVEEYVKYKFTETLFDTLGTMQKYRDECIGYARKHSQDNSAETNK